MASLQWAPFWVSYVDRGCFAILNELPKCIFVRLSIRKWFVIVADLQSNVLQLYRGHISLKDTHGSPVRCRPWIQIWPKWYQCNCCSMFNIVIIAIYRESIVDFALEIGSSVHRRCCRCIIYVTKYNVLWGMLFASAKIISHEEYLGSRPKCSKASPWALHAINTLGHPLIF